MIHIHAFTFNPFQENTYVLHDEQKNAVVIDAGCYTHQEETEIRQYIDEQGLVLQALLNTHCHVDHVLGLRMLQNTYKVPIFIPKAELQMMQMSRAYGMTMGIMVDLPLDVDADLVGGMKLQYGSIQLQVIDTPGHSPGHLSFYLGSNAAVFSGDVLFRGSIGRTDLPGGNYAVLMKSIKGLTEQLPAETTVYAGHGEPTTLQHEKQHNPFLIEYFNHLRPIN